MSSANERLLARLRERFAETEVEQLVGQYRPGELSAFLAELDPAWDHRRYWIETNLWIRTKDRRQILLEFNEIQERYWAEEEDYGIILKYRQGGISTLKLAEYFEDTVHHPNTVTVIVAHDLESTQKLFRIVKLYYDRLPLAERQKLCKNPNRPQVSTKRELFFDRINSTIVVGTAGSRTFGSGLTINNLHCSEVAKWPDPGETMTSLLQAVPLGGRVTVESTAKGVGGYFHHEYVLGKNGQSRFKPHFYPWFIHKEYQLPLDPGETLAYTADEQALVEGHGLTPEQIKWRRDTIAKQADTDGYTKEDRFAQEYPEDDVSCFLTTGRPVFHMPSVVLGQAMWAKPPVAVGRLIKVSRPNGTQAIEFEENPRGYLKLWERPEPHTGYLIPADVAEGLAHGDFSYAPVLRRRDRVQVAAWHGHIDADLFGEELVLLGTWYNNALIAPEDNNHGLTTITTIRHALYPFLYRRQSINKITQTLEEKLGWKTTPVTKPLMIDALAALIRELQLGMRDEMFWHEAMTYVLDDQGGTNAESGEFDDRVMATAIFAHLNGTLPLVEKAPPPPKSALQSHKEQIAKRAAANRLRVL